MATSVDMTLNTGRSLNQALLAAAGPELDDFILEHIYQPHAGDVHVVPGFGLPVPHILVVITPVWRPGREGEDRDLLRCYRSIMEMAGRMELKTLAIPAIGAGKGQFPAPRMARLALQAIRERMPEALQELRIVCNKTATCDAFAERLKVIAADARTFPDSDDGSSH